VPSIAAVQPVHVATWIEVSTRELAAPSVKQRLATLATCSTGWQRPGRTDQPAHTVRGRRHVVTSGQTPVLDPAEACALLDSIDVSIVAGLRDRALIGLMVYSFARIGAALAMTVERRRWASARGAVYARVDERYLRASRFRDRHRSVPAAYTMGGATLAGGDTRCHRGERRCCRCVERIKALSRITVGGSSCQLHRQQR